LNEAAIERRTGRGLRCGKETEEQQPKVQRATVVAASRSCSDKTVTKKPRQEIQTMMADMMSMIAPSSAPAAPKKKTTRRKSTAKKAGAKKAGARKTVKRAGAKKSAKKATKKRSVKRAGAKKSAKKATKKRSAKKATKKRSAKKSAKRGTKRASKR